MRAREPDTTGTVECDGVNIGYEVFGEGDLAVLLLPTWTIVHSRVWKMQVPFLAERYKVVTFDRPGNGGSERSLDPRHYSVEAVTQQALGVMDAAGVDRAISISLSQGAQDNLNLAAGHADRILGAVLVGASTTIEPLHAGRAGAVARFYDTPEGDPEGWERLNARFWRERYGEFTSFFFGECFSEPHSTKQVEDCLLWATETNPDVLLADVGAVSSPDEIEARAGEVQIPTLFIHGAEDRVSPPERSEILASRAGGELVLIDGGGHIPQARDPVRTNLLIDDFIQKLAQRAPQQRRWTRARNRQKRALFVSSPIGLGHARRDVAVAQELRRLHPDLEIEWLAQHPVTKVLTDAGECVHPASHRMASESAHIESESGEHRLHCFQAWRRMDEILLADFMVFLDVINERDYDLVVGDEAWEVDYFLHENPELKRFAYVWMTDFVGWLPMPEGGQHEARLTADYNAEMIGHIARHPRVRDLALFIGSPDNIVPDRFGPDLPLIREWTEEHYSFPGYVSGFDPSQVADRPALRDELGYEEGEPVCVVTVGGSGVGSGLLQRLIAAHPAAEARLPGLRTLVVTGPRIDPESLPQADGVEVRSYVPGLYRHLAASDLAVVQGGLTTCMELTATQRPFLYLPLRQHFEQNFHVHHRLEGHGAGRRMDFDEADPDALAEAMVNEMKSEPNYRPVEPDGATRVAEAIGTLL